MRFPKRQKFIKKPQKKTTNIPRWCAVLSRTNSTGKNLPVELPVLIKAVRWYNLKSLSFLNDLP